MKINESLYRSFDQEAIEQARYGEAELIAKMKSEFEHFMAQTREQLKLVAEALDEHDRVGPPSPIEASDRVEAEAIDRTGNHTPANDEAQIDASAPRVPSQSEIENDLAVTPPTDSETDDFDIWPDNVWQSSNPSNGKESASKDASFPEAHIGSMETDWNGIAQRHQDCEVPESPQSSGDWETDPFERLDAIKARLARQIKKS